MNNIISKNRRLKSFLFLITCFIIGSFPHFFKIKNFIYYSFAISMIVAFYGLLLLTKSRKIKLLNFSLINNESINNLPILDILVAAKDEANVITTLVERLLNLEYPPDKLNIYIIDDGSNDNTPIILNGLSQRFNKLKVIRRANDAGGGKSGALNYALQFTDGDWILILYADAQLKKDSLIRLFKFVNSGGWSAVQLRKSVLNTNKNVLTSCQSMEMAMDAIIQQGRFPSGVVELRGNGQFLKRSSLDQCGGFNEDTVTDDLDLSFKFLIEKALVGILWDPPVQEEAVESWGALWKQRQRWAEGGLQRFFDYWWFLLFSNQINLSKRRDLVCFFLLQYALPVVSFVDGILAILTRSLPVYWPFSLIAFTVSGVAYWRGCSRRSEGPILPRPNLINISLAIFYLSHWFLVIPWVAVKMALLPKKLVWAKTLHRGQQSARI